MINMIWKLIGRKIFYPTILLLFIVWGWIATESGLKTTLWVAKHFLPGTLSYQKLEGTLIDTIQMHDVQFDSPQFIFTAQSLSFHGQIVQLLNNTIDLDIIKIENAQLILNDHKNKPITITKVMGSLELQALGKHWSFILDHFEGTWEKHNQFKWTHSLEHKNKIDWELKFIDDENSLISHGSFTKNNTENVWNGTISDFRLTSPTISDWALTEQSPIQITQDELSIPSLTLKNTTPLKEGFKPNIHLEHFKITHLFEEQHLEGTLSSKMNDLRFILKLLPVIARPTGLISTTIEIGGTLTDPSLYLNANLSNGQFYLPKDRIKIKNLKLDITGNILDKLTIEGSGNSGEGAFQLNGFAEPFKPDSPNHLDLIGKNLRLHNTANAYIIASPELSLEYKDKVLYVEGTVQIPEGWINQPEEKSVARSNDVVYLNPTKPSLEHEVFKLIPSITLLIDEGFHYKGNGLDATLSGKIHVEQRPDGLYSGEGRLTIIKGRYRVHEIHRGRLLFIPGTLLNNPLLDIRIVPKTSLTQKESGFYVQGTLQKPMVQLSSSAHLQESEILLGTEETGSQQKQLASKTARLLAMSGNPLIERLQSSIGLEEFNVESKTSQKSLNTLNTQGSVDTVLVLGRSLSERIYLQFIQGLLEPTSTIRLKYALTPSLTTSVETGTEGQGTDLIYTKETD